MKKITFLLITLSFVYNSFAGSTETSIRLPQLEGSYWEGSTKTASFNCGLEFSNISHVSIELGGYYNPGILQIVGSSQTVLQDIPLRSKSPLVSTDWETDDILPPNAGTFTGFAFYSPLAQDSNWVNLQNGNIEIKLEMPSYFIIAIYTSISPAYYSINRAYLHIAADCNSIKLEPNSSQYLLAGSEYRIEWIDCRYNTTAEYGNYNISFSIDNGTNWIPTVGTPLSNINYYDWQVPEISEENCLLKIEDANSSLSDISNETFAIYECIAPPAGDFTNDCYIDFLDLQTISSDWLQVDSYTFTDLEDFLVNWLDCSNIFDTECEL